MPGGLSPTALEGVARLGRSMPFAQAAAELAFFWGLAVSPDTVRRHTERAGAALAAAEDAEAAVPLWAGPDPATGPTVAQWSMDGAMVPLAPRGWAEVKTAVVGAVAPGRAGGDARATDLVYASRLVEADGFASDVRRLVRRTGLQTAGTVVAVNDGAAWIQGILDIYRPDAVRVLDFPHAVGHLAAAGAAAFGPDTPALHAWLDRQATTLRHDAPEPVLAALRALPVDRAADPPTATDARDRALAYLEARLPQLAYAAFQAKGYPIGSGAVESANKLVVEARLKGSGMHWNRANVTPMVALRASACSERWATDWPTILQRLRHAEQARRERRRLQRHPPPPPPAPPNLRLLRSAARKLRAQRSTGYPRKRAS